MLAWIQAFLTDTLMKLFFWIKKQAKSNGDACIEPSRAILDEPDSGLDIDAIKAMAEVINKLIKKSAGVIVITTHLTRILGYVNKLDKVNVM